MAPVMKKIEEVVLRPIGNVIGTLMSSVFDWMYGTMPWLTVAVLSALMPFIVMTGMHYALMPLFMSNLATLGYDVVILVTMFCSNLAQGGASLGVAVKTPVHHRPLQAYPALPYPFPWNPRD